MLKEKKMIPSDSVFAHLLKQIRLFLPEKERENNFLLRRIVTCYLFQWDEKNKRSIVLPNDFVNSYLSFFYFIEEEFRRDVPNWAEIKMAIADCYFLDILKRPEDARIYIAMKLPQIMEQFEKSFPEPKWKKMIYSK